jgi:parallel beta-helix repeat protein
MRRASNASHLAAALLAAALLTLSGATPAVAQGEVTITVDSTSNVVDFGGAQMAADLPGPDGRTSLREAAIASTNTAGPETIAFAIPTSDPGFTGDEFVIPIDPASPEDELTVGDDGTTIDATTQPGGFPIAVQGGPQSTDSDTGLHITSSGNDVIGLGIRGYVNGILVAGGSDNLISGVTATGNANAIQLSGRGTGTGNTVSGSTIRDSLRVGIAVVNTIGVTVDGNTIVGNGTRGVFILGADEVTVTGNRIADNAIHGIEFATETNFAFVPDPATRGGVASGNTITGNGAFGVRVDGADRFTITRNVIAGNAGLGIDLSGGKQDAFGVTQNDAKDRDAGANQRLNFPERLMATDDGTATVVEGRIDAPDPQSVTIELFANGAPDPSGHGEGETFVGTATPEANGRFTATLASGLAGQWLTATSTDPAGNTSEFSEAVQVGVPRR